MIDILVYLFENYCNFQAHPKRAALARKLSAAGFEQLEISEALDWLGELKAAHPPESAGKPGSLRIYTEEEQLRLGVESLSFVIFLEKAGVLTPPLRELVIELGMTLNAGPLSLEKFKVVVLMVLWSREQDIEPLIIEELLCADDPELLH